MSGNGGSHNQRRSAAVIISSDRAHIGTYEDHSGPAATGWLMERDFHVLDKRVVPDDADALRDALADFVDQSVELIVISGGTGLGHRDVTPQVLDETCDYQVPGFGELMRQGSLQYSLNAYLSRCGGWVKGRSLVLALPGNPKAVTEQLGILESLLPHALKSLHGECHDRRAPGTPAAGRP